MTLKERTELNAPCSTICDFNRCWSTEPNVLLASFNILSQKEAMSFLNWAFDSRSFCCSKVLLLPSLRLEPSLERLTWLKTETALLILPSFSAKLELSIAKLNIFYTITIFWFCIFSLYDSSLNWSTHVYRLQSKKFIHV